VHRYLGSFHGSSAFYTWLYRIVVNLCVDHLRHRAHDAVNRLTTTACCTMSTRPAYAVEHSRPAASGDREELGEQLQKAMLTLSPIHRAVLNLRETEGLSYEQMAKVMGCSVGTIMSRLFHARRKMQKALQAYLTDGEAKQAGGRA